MCLPFLQQAVGLCWILLTHGVNSERRFRCYWQALPLFWQGVPQKWQGLPLFAEMHGFSAGLGWELRQCWDFIRTFAQICEECVSAEALASHKC